MSEEMEPLEGFEEEFIPKEYDIMDQFETLSFKEKWQRVSDGLDAPKDSGEYKYAKLQMVRLSSPVAAIFVPLLFMGILVLFASIKKDPPPQVAVEIIEPEPIEELEIIEEIEPEEIEPPEPMDEMVDDFAPDVNMDNPTPSPPTDFSPQPTEFDAVAMVKSPVVMKGIYGSRSPGARGAAMSGYGGSGAGEAAVIRALRWMKKHQSENGSWSAATGGLGGGQGAPAAHTAIGLLAFLAHGETPASAEFGYTVEKAIKFLVEDQLDSGHFKSKDGHDYTQPIVAYALCEAYALTKVPVLKDAAEKAIIPVIKGQHANGGWDYNLKQTARDDTSYMGWCAQAIKAAVMAGLYVDGLKECYLKARDGFKKNYKGDSVVGGFGYTGPKAGGLTGVGTLCMQLTGAANAQEVHGGLGWIEKNEHVSWEAPKGNIYYWYYDTQAMFHTGGNRWDTWNKQFSPAMTKSQTVVKGAIENLKGKMVDIGYWTPPAGTKGDHLSGMFRTALCTLSLEVYYRYLPTFKKSDVEEAPAVEVPKDDDIKIDIDI